MLVFRLVVINFIGHLVHCDVYRYEGDVPKVAVEFKGNDRKFAARLEFASSTTFFFDKECVHCFEGPPPNLVDASGMTSNGTLLTTIHRTAAAAALHTANCTLDGRRVRDALVPLVRSVDSRVRFAEDGQLGLTGGGASSWKRNVFGAGRAYLVLRRGAFAQDLGTKRIRKTHGYLNIGHSDGLPGCGTFTYYPTIDSDDWALAVSLVIDHQRYDGMAAFFTPADVSAVPQHVYGKHYRKGLSGTSVPRFQVLIDGHSYTTPPRNFVHYADGEARVKVRRNRNVNSSVELGMDFLRERCVSFRADRGKCVSIGLAKAEPLDDDPVFESADVTTTTSTSTTERPTQSTSTRTTVIGSPEDIVESDNFLMTSQVDECDLVQDSGTMTRTCSTFLIACTYWAMVQ